MKQNKIKIFNGFTLIKEIKARKEKEREQSKNWRVDEIPKELKN